MMNRDPRKKRKVLITLQFTDAREIVAANAHG